MQADSLVAVFPVHHIFIWLPAHLVKHSVAVPYDHGPPSPGQVRCQQCGNLHIRQSSLTGFVFPCKMSRKDNGVFLKILRVIIFFRPPDQGLFQCLVHILANIIKILSHLFATVFFIKKRPAHIVAGPYADPCGVVILLQTRCASC